MLPFRSRQLRSLSLRPKNILEVFLSNTCIRCNLWRNASPTLKKNLNIMSSHILKGFKITSFFVWKWSCVGGSDSVRRWKTRPVCLVRGGFQRKLLFVSAIQHSRFRYDSSVESIWRISRQSYWQADHIWWLIALKLLSDLRTKK